MERSFCKEWCLDRFWSLVLLASQILWWTAQVFCSICPVVLLAAAVYFLIERRLTKCSWTSCGWWRCWVKCFCVFLDGKWWLTTIFIAGTMVLNGGTMVEQWWIVAHNGGGRWQLDDCYWWSIMVAGQWRFQYCLIPDNKKGHTVAKQWQKLQMILFTNWPMVVEGYRP